MNVPRPVCRLVLDLLRSDVGMEHPFGSVSDIALELKLITNEPNGHTTTPQPNFGKRMYGRSQELRTLVEAAATVTTHHVHLFSVELTQKEMDVAKKCAEDKTMMIKGEARL